MNACDARLAIESSFKKLIEEKPYNMISVSNICETAHVSRKSFYVHFSNKEDILASIFQKDAIAPIRNINLLFSQPQTYDMYPVMYEKIYEQIYASKRFYKKLVGPMKGKDDTFLRIATQEIYELNIEILASHNYRGDSLKADYISYFFAASQAMLIQKWISDDMPYTPEQLARLYNEMVNDFWIGTFEPKNLRTSPF